MTVFNEADPDKPILLNRESMLPVREMCFIDISDDRMKAVARFYPPSNKGRELDLEEVKSQCRLAGIAFGVDDNVINAFLSRERILKALR